VASVQPYDFFPSSDSADMQRRHVFAYAVLEALGSGRVRYTKDFRQTSFNMKNYAFYDSFSEKNDLFKGHARDELDRLP
jgi:hypothetical protein